VDFAYGGALAVADVTFQVRYGEVVALVGQTGSGKSTLARLALGLLRPATGTVELCGLRTDRTPMPALAAHGGLVLQNPLHQLLASRVDDELRLGLSQLPPADAAARTEETLDALGLTGVRARHPLSLSEGQRRRVALAAVLVRRPRMLVLDEPTLGQDEQGRAALARIVAGLAAAGTGVLAISHDPEFVNDACQRVLRLEAGRIVADLPLAWARSQPGRLAQAGIVLGDVPATALHLARCGWRTAARSVAELAAALPPAAG
jgi:energy-coupling factor transport system ATP-binding protein